MRRLPFMSGAPAREPTTIRGFPDRDAGLLCY
jgi:hypothetical protein